MAGAHFSGQVAISAIDGNQLLALLFPKADLTAGVSSLPGTITIRGSGTSDQLDTSATVKASALQAQVDGVTSLKDGFAFTARQRLKLDA